ncbi:hypothetical protein BU23DRAFT_106492 [Bimuria novae-zelandiae CBS 107.79]|uniref:Uncharacterized protein n=1 Tax=Bimuria novae-zelandiae CBS 107.79 TaxID=1447943 RepID=A0A6A5VVQ8_9PLEO|nr:hypothetical protein BU23DRAFT_106492 [Bimuria novae-zelandiae CBS 107.79]
MWSSPRRRVWPGNMRGRRSLAAGWSPMFILPKGETEFHESNPGTIQRQGLSEQRSCGGTLWLLMNCTYRFQYYFCMETYRSVTISRG